MHRDLGAQGTHRLQDVSSETKKASKASGGANNGAVGTGAERWLGDGWGSRANWSNWGGWNGGVGVGWDRGRWAGGALDNWGNRDWLGDGARAVGDGQGGGLSDSVGLVVEGQGGGLWAEGGVVGVDLSDPGDVAGSDGGHEGSGDGGVGELHLDGNYFWKVKSFEFII